MECEICGKQCNNPVEIEIDGATMLVCNECSSLGKRVRSRNLQRTSHSAFIPYKRSPLPGIKKNELDIGLSLAPDYGERIRKAREKRGWKREELAKKLFEKESVLHRIESGHFKPDDKLIEKIESLLGISLREEED